jgi:hypothetical protein
MDHPDTKHQRLVAENANGFKYRKHLHCGASTCPFQQEIESKNERQQGEGNAVSLPPSLPPMLSYYTWEGKSWLLSLYP